MSDSVVYAYGVVRSDFPAGRVPGGIDDAAVELVRDGGVAALASHLSARDYAPAMIEERSGEVAWLSPRAMAHDRVLTWAQEHGGVIPLPMFSMWGSSNALAATLRDRAAALERVFAKVQDADEFGLRVYRRDAEMLAHIDTIDHEIAALRREADGASPGQRYLLERKISERGSAAIRGASQRMAREVFEDLRAFAREALARPLTPDRSAAADATMVLNGAFLVGRPQLEAFRAAVARHMGENEARGLAFDFTGPWPPYNFVGDAGGTASGDSGR
ncbi:MAG TPA: GvpL/GvpF family gas vesicle protein [Gemmatimonadaceae bacterium]|nr:GvpL/GvpF family gas vesicle protein [Gemmatimonadaceae bacterium]